MKYDNSVRFSAFKIYILTGSFSSTAIASSVSVDTVRAWAEEEDWTSKLKDHRQKIQQQILKDLYRYQISKLKEFNRQMFTECSDKSTETFSVNKVKKRRAEYGSKGLDFEVEELKIEWFVKSLKEQTEDHHQLENGQLIYFTQTNCTFGGVRYWFLCPDCNRRCASLFKQKNHFTCRICSKLQYQRY